jgi:hypothetical protein
MDVADIRRNVEELLLIPKGHRLEMTGFSDFSSKYPRLHALVCDVTSTDDDVRRFVGMMLGALSKLDAHEITIDDATKEIGQAVIHRFHPEALEK